jgi:S1-C subfamily serine protease
MKASLWALGLLLLYAANIPLSAQPSGTGGLMFDEIRTRAENGDAALQYQLGLCYFNGNNVAKDYLEAAQWWRKSAVQDYAPAQYQFGLCCYAGYGVEQDYAESVKWWSKAAERGNALAQYNLGCCYFYGYGAGKNLVAADKWLNVASAAGNEYARQLLPRVEAMMSSDEIDMAQQSVRDFKPIPSSEADAPPVVSGVPVNTSPAASGTGFFVTDDGFLVTNNHVVKNAAQIYLVTDTGRLDATVVKTDVQHDLALLKAEGNFESLPVVPSGTVPLGATVATVGYPDVQLQGQSPKLAKGEIAALAGAHDDPRYFQISVPLQPGNSGGALVDERGNVVGIVAAKLDANAALLTSGALPENVNYAVKSSYLLNFLDSDSDLAGKLKAPDTSPREFENVVQSAERATVLVLVIH